MRSFKGLTQAEHDCQLKMSVCMAPMCPPATVVILKSISTLLTQPLIRNLNLMQTKRNKAAILELELVEAWKLQI